MSVARRLKEVVTSLTPKQAVLLWLKEAQHLGVVGYLEKSYNSRACELPRARLPEMVGNAVRESLGKQGVEAQSIEHAVREAQKQTDCLVVLIRDLHRVVTLECIVNPPYILLLHEKFRRLLEHFVHSEKFEPMSWEIWRSILIQRLSCMWRLKETIAGVSEKYFDHHPLLFPEDAETFNSQIDALEELAKHYNSFKGGFPGWTAIESGALACSLHEQVLAEVEERVARARSTTLEDFGESEAAWKLVEPYARAALEELRASRSVLQGGD